MAICLQKSHEVPPLQKKTYIYIYLYNDNNNNYNKILKDRVQVKFSYSSWWPKWLQLVVLQVSLGTSYDAMLFLPWFLTIFSCN